MLFIFIHTIIMLTILLHQINKINAFKFNTINRIVFKPLVFDSKSIKAKKIPNSDDPNWITINLNDEKTNEAIDMNDRLTEAKGWISKKLSDNDIKLLNKSLNIEEEINSITNNKNKQSNKKKVTKESLMSYDNINEARILGYLEVNPHICSGCGTPFQSKSVDSPGYLSKEKFNERRLVIQQIKAKQEAIKILTDAGIDINSSLAEEILKKADISKDTIEGVKRIGRKNDKRVVKSEDEVVDQQVEKELKLNIPLDGLEDDVKQLINDINNEANPKQPRQRLSIRKSVKSDSIESDSKIDIQLDSKLINELDNQIESILERENNQINNKINKKIDNKRDDSIDTSTDETICVCQRCFRLQQYGTGSIEPILRPGWSDNELLLPNRFESLLTEISKTKALVVFIVDVFDLHGSLLTNLRNIIGDNPIVIGINKIDLLPKDVSMIRLKSYIMNELKEKCKLQSVKEIEKLNFQRIEKIKIVKQNFPKSDVFDQLEENTQKVVQSRHNRKGYIEPIDESGLLRSDHLFFISCTTNYNVQNFLSFINNLAINNNNKVYIIGTANTGKSSFINKLIDHNKLTTSSSSKSNNKGTKIDKSVAQSTVSNLPGTTLDFLKIRLSNGVTVIDTPGLINEGQLTTLLTTNELKKVIPSKQINAITLRVEEGKTVLIGGIASITLLEGRPFYFTFFISNEIKLHPTDSTKAESFLEKHIGELIYPPDSLERLKELGPPTYHEFSIEGESWKKSTTDIVISGLGWITVTGPGIAKVKVGVPKQTSVSTRPALLPYEATYTTAKFTGGRLLKKSKKPGAAGSNSYGWRA